MENIDKKRERDREKLSELRSLCTLKSLYFNFSSAFLALPGWSVGKSAGLIC